MIKKCCLILILLLTSCSVANQEESINATNLNNTLYFNEEIGLFTLTTDEKVQPGEEIKIFGDLIMLESYPVQVQGVTKIENLGLNEHKLHLSLRILEELIAQDPALGENKTFLGLDVKGLSDSEKNSLMYLLQNEGYEVEIVDSKDIFTQHDTVNNGYKDGQGFLYILELEESTFKADVWVSGVGALYSTGKFTKENGLYKITFDNIAIS